LRIVTESRRTITIDKPKEAEGFDSIQISGDRRHVGWLEEWPNCCTSYPIPRKLVIYSNGRKRAYVGAVDSRPTFGSGARL
jgi:hypothetical protein